MSRFKSFRVGIAAVAIAFCSFTAVQSGCVLLAAGAAGGAAVAYFKGELKATVNYPTDKVQKAAKKALVSDLRFIAISEKEDATLAEYCYRNIKDEKIVVSLEMVDDNTTTIRIRIGTFGDENLSQLILSKIQKRLN
jgi:hypothetical protein